MLLAPEISIWPQGLSYLRTVHAAVSANIIMINIYFEVIHVAANSSGHRDGRLRVDESIGRFCVGPRAMDERSKGRNVSAGGHSRGPQDKCSIRTPTNSAP